MSDPTDAVDFPAFRPRAPWYGADLQSIAYEVLAKRIDQAKWPSRVVEVEAGDGSGDLFVHHLHLPEEPAKRPTVMLLHGLGGSADAGYLWLATLDLLRRGYPVLRMNKRGCGDGADRAGGCAWHGDTAVFAATARHLVEHHETLCLANTDLAAIAFSLGGNTLVQWLADEAGRDGPTLLAAATISAPIDLVTSTKQLDGMRNWPYRPYLLKKLRDHACRENADASDELRQAARDCRSMWEFGDMFNAPRLGMSGGEEYFGSASLVERLPKVEVPLLMIHSRDDPWVPHAQYEEMDWSACRNVTTLFSNRGGHVGFHATGPSDAWDVHCADQFIQDHATSKA
jgi:predicted alpha/beta-fold hydrolase